MPQASVRHEVAKSEIFSSPRSPAQNQLRLGVPLLVRATAGCGRCVAPSPNRRKPIRRSAALVSNFVSVFPTFEPSPSAPPLATAAHRITSKHGLGEAAVNPAAPNGILPCRAIRAPDRAA